MKTVSPEVLSLLQASSEICFAEVYTITLVGGTIMRHTDLDIDITFDGHTFSADGLLLKRTSLKQERGLVVSELEIEAIPVGQQIQGVDFLAACRNGALDGATIRVQRVFMSGMAEPLNIVGSINMFTGTVEDIDNLTRSSVTLKVASMLAKLNVNWPRLLYQPACVWAVYDASCGVDRAAKTVTGSVSTGSTVLSVNTGLAQASGYFDLGVITFTSGANAGAARTIKTYADGTVSLILPLLHTPAAGDAFSIYPGCDRTMATCSEKFNNLAAFRGFPYVPQPEMAM